MSADELTAHLTALGVELLGPAGPRLLDEARLRHWRNAWSVPLGREDMRRACDGFEALMDRLWAHGADAAGPVNRQLAVIIRALRLETAELGETGARRGREAARLIGAPARRPAAPAPSGSPRHSAISIRALRSV